MKNNLHYKKLTLKSYLKLWKNVSYYNYIYQVFIILLKLFGIF